MKFFGVVKSIIVLLFIIVPHTLGVIREVDFDVNGRGDQVVTTVLKDFGVGQHGIVKFKVSVSNLATNAVVVLFTREQLDRHLTNDDAQALVDNKWTLTSLICNLPGALRVPITNSTIEYESGVPSEALYTLMILHCGKGKGNINGSLQLVNERITGEVDEHLSLGETGLPMLYIVLVIIYFMLCTAWVISFCFMKNRTPLHSVLTFVLCVQFAQAIVQSMYYYRSSTYGSLSNTMIIINGLANCFRDTSFLVVLQLTAVGWKITIDSISTRALVLYSMLFLMYAFLGLLESFCNLHGGGGDDDPYCLMYFLGEFVARPFFMISSIIANNLNITILRSGIMGSAWTPNTPKTYSQLIFFDTFRWSLLAYALLPTLLLVVNLSLLSWKFTWVNDLLGEIVILLIFVLLSFTFQPTRSSEIALARISESISKNIPFSDASSNIENDRSASYQPQRDSTMRSFRFSTPTLRPSFRRRRNRNANSDDTSVNSDSGTSSTAPQPEIELSEIPNTSVAVV